MDLCNSLNAAFNSLNIKNITCCSDIVSPQSSFEEWNKRIFLNSNINIMNNNVMTVCQENGQGGGRMNLKGIFVKNVDGCKGSLPDLTMFPSLEKIHIEHCDLTGAELTWDKIQLNNLKELSLVKLELYGQIPSQIGNFQNLNKLDLSENRLSGPISNSISKLPNLNHLNVADNYFNGSITNVFENSSKLEYLNASNTLIVGAFNGIPSLKKCEMPNSVCKNQPDSNNLCNIRVCNIENSSQYTTMTIIIIVFVLLFMVMGYGLIKFAQEKKKNKSDSMSIENMKKLDSKSKKNKNDTSKSLFHDDSKSVNNETTNRQHYLGHDDDEEMRWVQLTTVEVVENEEKLQPTGSQATLN